MSTGNLQIQLPISKVTLEKCAQGSWAVNVYDNNDNFVIRHHLGKGDVALLESGEQLQANLDNYSLLEECSPPNWPRKDFVKHLFQLWEDKASSPYKTDRFKNALIAISMISIKPCDEVAAKSFTCSLMKKLAEQALKPMPKAG